MPGKFNRAEEIRNYAQENNNIPDFKEFSDFFQIATGIAYT